MMTAARRAEGQNAEPGQELIARLSQAATTAARAVLGRLVTDRGPS